MENIAIIGAGGYGMALGECLSLTGTNHISFISRNEKIVNSINHSHTNDQYFPGRKLNPRLRANCSFEPIKDCSAIFLAVPSHAIEECLEGCIPHLNAETLVINLAKGMSIDGGLIYDQLEAQRKAALKGPTFATEMFNGLPSSLTFGSENSTDVELIDMIFHDSKITLDYTHDVRGVEYLSVLKNVYAIALGIVAGTYNSPNVDFIILTKAVKEMRAYLEHAGCDPNTIFNYCGIGDLGLTALNDLSRNRTLGLLIGKGFLGDNPGNSVVVEGLRAVQIFSQNAEEWAAGDEFPVLLSLNAFLKGETTLSDFISSSVG